MPVIPNKCKHPFTCPDCRRIYDQDISLTCPYCKKFWPRCPDIKCGNDLTHPQSCRACYKLKDPRPLPTTIKKSGWGGRRAGAGAPSGSMNHLKTGNRSAQIRRAIALLGEHEELRPLLYLIARLATDGEVPKNTRRLINKALGDHNPFAKDGSGRSMRSA
jgi:hypothetical protein